MTGEKFFKLGLSGEKIQLDKLKERLEKRELNSAPALECLFNIFDNGDKVLDKTELQNIWNCLNTTASKNGNKVLDTDEAIAFLQEKLNVSDITEIGLNVQSLYQFIEHTQSDYSKITITEEQAQEQVVSTIASDVHSAYLLYQNTHNGVVTKGYDAIKNYFNNELGSSNVEEVLALQNEAVNFLIDAKQGSLTKKEYYLENVDHLKKMIMRRLLVKDENTGINFIDKHRGKLSSKDLERVVRNYLDRYVRELGTLENIKKVQVGLTKFTEEGTNKFLEQFLANALNQQTEGGRTLDNIGVRDTLKLGNEFQ